MPSFPVLLLQVSVTLCLFWIVYVLFIRRIRLFAMQRTYLIAGLVLSLTLPFIYPAFPVQETVGMSEWVLVLSPDQLSSPEFTSPESINNPGPFSWLGILLAIYCTGVAFRLSLLVREALAIRNLYLSGEREYTENYVVIHSPATKRTFSFFRLIFLGKGMNSTSRHFAVLHEYAHVWGYHSWDNLLFELARVLLWFHPAIHHFKKYLNEVHEFLADEYVVSTCGTPKSYAEFLFAHTCQADQRLKLGLSNKLITKRIVMLSKPSIHRLNHLFLLILIPLALTGLAACSMFEKESSPVNEIEGLATADDSNSEYKGRIIRNISWNGNVAYSDAVLNESFGIRPGDSFDKDERVSVFYHYCSYQPCLPGSGRPDFYYFRRAGNENRINSHLFRWRRIAVAYGLCRYPAR